MRGMTAPQSKTTLPLLALAAAAAVTLWIHFRLLGDLGPGQRAHAWKRFAIHFFCAATIAQMLRSGLHGLELARWIRPLGPRLWFWLPVVIGPLLIFLREPLDVAAGGPLVKSYLDPAGWALGLVADRLATRLLAARNWAAARDLSPACQRLCEPLCLWPCPATAAPCLHPFHQRNPAYSGPTRLRGHLLARPLAPRLLNAYACSAQQAADLEKELVGCL